MHSPTVYSNDLTCAWRSVRDFVAAPKGNGRATVNASTIDNTRLVHGGAELRAEYGCNERVLLVEENAAMQDALAQMLGSLGFDVRIAPDAASALQLWASSNERPHLILADATMPDGGGIELLRAVRADDAHFPVVLMTAFPAQAPLIDALRLRADDFLAKPIAVAELKSVLDRALETRRKRLDCEHEEARASRLQAVLETAIAVNHEINNPLATISASAQLLRHQLQMSGASQAQGNSTEGNSNAVPGKRAKIDQVNGAASVALGPRAGAVGEVFAGDIAVGESSTDETAVMQHLLDVIIDQCERIACFNRKLNTVVNPVTRVAGGQKMLDVDNSHSQ